MLEALTRQNDTLQDMMNRLTNKLLKKKSSEEERSSKPDDRGLKIEVPECNRTSEPEVYLEWERSLERFFEYKDTPQEKKYEVDVLKLTKYASI